MYMLHKNIYMRLCASLNLIRRYTYIASAYKRIPVQNYRLVKQRFVMPIAPHKFPQPPIANESSNHHFRSGAAPSRQRCRSLKQCSVGWESHCGWRWASAWEAAEASLGRLHRRLVSESEPQLVPPPM